MSDHLPVSNTVSRKQEGIRDTDAHRCPYCGASKWYEQMVTALEALVKEMDQEHADRYFAGKLKAILVTHRGP